MWGIFDRYFGKGLVSSYLTALLFVVFLFMVFDLLLNMGGYLGVAQRRQISVGQLMLMWGQFHLLSLPWLFVTVAPFVTVVSSMFVMARLAAANEIVPMVFSGRSMTRVLRPALILSALSALSMVGIWEFVIPHLSGPMEQVGSFLDEDTGGALEAIVLRSPDGDKTLMCDRYVPDRQRMEGVLMLDQSRGPADLEQIKARVAEWDPQRVDWLLIDGERSNGGERRPAEWLGFSEAAPSAVMLAGREQVTSSLLSYSELAALLALSPGRHDLVIALHYHFTWPLANVVLLLLALPFAVHFERGGGIGRVVLAIAVCGTYLAVDLACQNLGMTEYLHPVVAAWTPVIVFGSLSAVMFGGMRS